MSKPFLPDQGVAGFSYHLLGYGPPADDDEATARSRIGRMASATLRRPISCSSVAAPLVPPGTSGIPLNRRGDGYLVPECEVTMSQGTRRGRPTPSSQSPEIFGQAWLAEPWAPARAGAWWRRTARGRHGSGSLLTTSPRSPLGTAGPGP